MSRANLKILIHPLSQVDIEAFISHPSHALLLRGRHASGKTQLAQFIAAQLLNIDTSALRHYPYYYEVRTEQDKKEITVAQIRELTTSMMRKTIGTQVIRRVAVIISAQLMNHEAQNALLKTLEEPPKDTVIILTTEDGAHLLSTIQSRTQHIDIKPVQLGYVHKQLTEFAHQDVEKAWQLAEGRARLIQELLQEGEHHSLQQAMITAKRIISSSVFERLILINSLSKDKVELLAILEAMSRLCSVLQRQKNQSKQQRVKLIVMQKQIIEATLALQANSQAKLVLLKLCTSI